MKKGLVIPGGCLIALAPLIVLAATIYTLMLPNIYCSQARISVSEDAPEINPFSDQEQYYAAYNPYFLRTQFEIIQSQPILYEVINRLNLQQAWGRDGEKLSREIALKILKNSVQVYQMRDTSLMVISVRRDNPDEAADIANELAETYRDYRLDEAIKTARRKIDAIGEAVVEQLKRVEEAEDKVKQLPGELTGEHGLEPGADKKRLMTRALNDVETERFIYNQLRAKLRQETITLKVPSNPVEIIDVAEPNRHPVSPNLFMNSLLSVVVAGFFALPGVVLLLLGLKKK